MNWHVFTKVNSFVHLNRSLSSSEWISRAFCVNSTFQFKNDRLLDNIDIWHETLDKISSDDLESYIDIPLWHVIGEWTVESFPEFLWFELLQVSIYNEDNESSVKELTKESTFNNLTFLQRDCIFTNPTYKSDNTFLQNGIDHNNDNSN